jgi:hypothetical protein
MLTLFFINMYNLLTHVYIFFQWLSHPSLASWCNFHLLTKESHYTCKCIINVSSFSLLSVKFCFHQIEIFSVPNLNVTVSLMSRSTVLVLQMPLINEDEEILAMWYHSDHYIGNSRHWTQQEIFHDGMYYVLKWSWPWSSFFPLAWQSIMQYMTTLTLIKFLHYFDSDMLILFDPIWCMQQGHISDKSGM